MRALDRASVPGGKGDRGDDHRYAGHLIAIVYLGVIASAAASSCSSCSFGLRQLPVTNVADVKRMYALEQEPHRRGAHRYDYAKIA
jgi:hypothetical protein